MTDTSDRIQNQFLTLALFFLCPFFSGAAEVDLPTVVKEGSAGELLQNDPVMPVQSGVTNRTSGTGSIVNSIQNQIPVSVSDYGRPGNLSQVRGLGMSSEDIDVQVFGVSLNSPQGGGYDFSVFPQFLWSNFSYRAGPSLNGFNPMSSAGTLSLVPWSAEALKKPGQEFEAGEYYSSAGSNQVFFKGKLPSRTAWVAGYSLIKSIGPSGSFSTSWSHGRNYSGAFHLIASDLDAEAQGPLDFPSPRARMRMSRVIPILQNSFQLLDFGSIRSSFFFDFSGMNYLDPDSGFQSRDRTQQWGVENALLLKDWKLGLSFRHVNFSGLGFAAPPQMIGNFQISKIFGENSWLIEPTLQGIWVNGYGFLPQGSVGVRKEWDRGTFAVFARSGISYKVPSLLDRYFVYYQFVGNPNLRTEESWTTAAGVELKRGAFEGMLQGYGQVRNNVRVLQNQSNVLPFTTVTNLGGATLFSIQNNLSYQFLNGWSVYHALSMNSSKIFATGRPFPYVPGILEILGARCQWMTSGLKAEWSLAVRLSSSYGIQANTSRVLPGYSVLDTGFELGLFKQMTLAIRIENLLDRTIESVAGYLTGRTFSIFIAGKI